jgi:hypothetical protein
MVRWRLVICLASFAQIAAGVTFFTLTTLREAAPFGLALGAGIGLLSLVSLANRSLIRVAIGANILLAVLTLLGAIPIVIALVTGAVPPSLAANAIGGIALAAASAASAIGLRRLWSRAAAEAEPARFL